MALIDVLNIQMNHKKILRLIRKFNLYAKIRRPNPYPHLEKATEVHRSIPNHLKRILSRTSQKKYS